MSLREPPLEDSRAGCSPVRMAISPDGRRIYVTARNTNAVEAVDATKLFSDPDPARVGLAPVGEAPVPVAVIDGGKKVVAGNSNRFAGGDAPPHSLLRCACILTRLHFGHFHFRCLW